MYRVLLVDDKILIREKIAQKIAIMSHGKAASTAIDREIGFWKGLGKEADRIQTVLYCDADYQKAYDQTVELMKREDGINLIAGLNLNAAVGVARAIRDLGLQDEVNLIGFDNDVEEIQYMEMGIMDCLIVQKPFSMGYFGICKACDVVNGKKVEPMIYVGTETITIDNIYTKENEKLLFTF